MRNIWPLQQRILALFLLVATTALAETADETLLERIALGSCVDQNRPQPIWDSILAANPQLLLLLGDNIYADTEDMAKMKADYETLAASPGFQRVRARLPILATWDDHDFGVNDGGREYPKKAEAAALFLDFFGEPEDSPRRAREGVYTAKIFGPPGKRVQIILLDGRTFRSPLRRDPSPRRRYRPDTDPATTLLPKTLLGEQQWVWLEDQLRQPAEVRLIGSGIQVLGYAAGFESWKNLPLEQERLFSVIRETEASGVIFLSGDAHFTQIKRGDGGVGYPLYDFTSSGLTHSQPKAAVRAAPLAIHHPYGGLNFGTVEFDWRGEDPKITLMAHDLRGHPVFRQSIRLSELQVPTVHID